MFLCGQTKGSCSVCLSSVWCTETIEKDVGVALSAGLGSACGFTVNL